MKYNEPTIYYLITHIQAKLLTGLRINEFIKCHSKY